MPFDRPADLLAGFIATRPDPEVPELIMVGEQWAPRGQRIGAHSHEDWEFYYQVEGLSRWRVARRTYEIQAGALFAAPPGVRHEMPEHQRGEHHYCFVAVDVARCARRIGSDVAEVFLKSSEPRVIESAGEARAAFQTLVREVSIVRPWRAAALRMATDAFVLEVARLLSGGEQRALGRHPAVTRALRLMEQEPERAWRVPVLARLAGCSPAHLTELFRRELGATPHQHLLTLRLERAAELLALGEIPVTHLALTLGFSSGQHFAAAFRRRFGHSPRQHARRAAPGS